ncbi:MAG: hypothetical protein ISQ08_07860 [Planctomycetes bacterium]|nr:hypothetical protein [Planctomycetota bacterium]MDA0948671.1 hypothetical protein [Planctomycetota bacterium]
MSPTLPLAALTTGELVGLVTVLALAGLLGVGVALLRRLAGLAERLEGLQRLESLDQRLKGLAESQGALDLRRLEHVLVDLRDSQKRSEERIAQALESREREPQPESTPGAPAPARLPERVINRLVALGYERIELLTPASEFEALVEGEGEVRVEARRSGATYKGRVLVKQGAIVEVALRPPYEIFP